MAARIRCSILAPESHEPTLPAAQRLPCLWHPLPCPATGSHRFSPAAALYPETQFHEVEGPA